jgi:hypothetical protein
MTSFSSLTVEEHVRGDTRWVAVRARGAEWSWLTPDEAAALGRLWLEKYGSTAESNSIPTEKHLRLVYAA